MAARDRDVVVLVRTRVKGKWSQFHPARVPGDFIIVELASGQFDDYEMPMMTEDDTPWALAVPLDELDGIWGNFMSGMTYNWHSSGRLVELEKKWGI